jgi:hypothetical protein
VLDPCLQFGLPTQPAAEQASYVAVYGHSFPTQFAGAVRDWAAARGVRLVSIGYHNPWAHEQRVDVGPEAFAALMAGAVAVATNFFHGCVFALANAKPFACAATPYRSNKVRALTELLGVERRLLGHDGDAGSVASCLDEPLDRAITQRLAQLRRQSAAYLDAALG